MEVRKILESDLDCRQWTDQDLVGGYLGVLTRASSATPELIGRKCFEEIMRRHQADIYRLGYRYFGNHDDAAEISQRTFVRVFEKLHTFKGKAALRTWIYQIAINLCKNLQRDEKRRFLRLEAGTEKTLELLNGESDAEAPTLEMERAERRTALLHAVETLPPTQKAVVILRVFEEYSFKEIASLLDSSLSAVKTNFHYGLKALKTQLAKTV